MSRRFTVNVDGVDVKVNGAPDGATAVRAPILVTYQGIDEDGDAFSSFGWAWSHMDVDARLGMITRGQKEIVRELLDEDGD